MSIDTVINIGSKIRKLDKEKSLKYHRYVRPVPVNKDAGKNHYTTYQVDVDKDFQIRMDTFKEVRDEESGFYYLSYKTSEADTYVRYIFGDICSDYFKWGVSEEKKKGKKTSLYLENSLVRGEEN
ncbi:MAG: hypothetical protein ACPG5P_04620, partial [Saprospiraceae bacterium]